MLGRVCTGYSIIYHKSCLLHEVCFVRCTLWDVACHGIHVSMVIGMPVRVCVCVCLSVCLCVFHISMLAYRMFAHLHAITHNRIKVLNFLLSKCLVTWLFCLCIVYPKLFGHSCDGQENDSYIIVRISCSLLLPNYLCFNFTWGKRVDVWSLDSWCSLLSCC